MDFARSTAIVVVSIEDSSFKKMVYGWRYYDADYRRSPFHHLQLSTSAVMPAAGHPARQPRRS